MTDWTPPPPGPATPPPAPPAPGAWSPGGPPSTPTPTGPPATTPGWTGNAPVGDGTLVERRPKAVVGGVLLLVAAGLLVLGTFLPWVSNQGQSLNGMSNFYCASGECIATDESIDAEFLRSDAIEIEAPGRATLVGAAILASFGLALVLAGRVVAVAILALVSSSLGLLVSLGLYAVADRVTDTWRFDATLGSGPMVVILSAAVGIAGSIVALAQRTPRQDQVPT